MSNAGDPTTTEVAIAADNAVINELMRGRYAKLDQLEIRAELEFLYGDVWDENQVKNQFVIKTANAPYAHVVRKIDNLSGTLAFIEQPRFYFLFKPDEDEHGDGTTRV